MVVGTLGEIVFQVTPETVETVESMKWAGSARWAVHDRHGGDALTEFTGLEPDSVQFELYLSAFLGVSPMKELEKIWEYERSGKAVGLTLGEHRYGRYRWGIESHTTEIESTDQEGNILSCRVKVVLIEYLKR